MSIISVVIMGLLNTLFIKSNVDFRDIFYGFSFRITIIFNIHRLPARFLESIYFLLTSSQLFEIAVYPKYAKSNKTEYYICKKIVL